MQTFYDQIPVFVDRENTIVGFSKKSIVEEFVSPIEELKSKKKEETIREMNSRIIQYTYKV